MLLFMISYLGGGLGVWILAIDHGAIWAALAWFSLFAVLQFVIFRCPHCGSLAIFTPNGLATPFVGRHCRHCGKEY